MPESKAYELPDKEKYPKLYKKTGGLFNKDTKKLSEAIASYARKNLSVKETDGIVRFLNVQGHKNLQPSQIKDNLPKLYKEGCVREVDFVLALQGEKIEKKDIFKVKEDSVSAICQAASCNRNNNILLWVGESMYDAGTPITKDDIFDNKTCRRLDMPIKRDQRTYKGRVIAIAATDGNLKQVKAIVEMNGEKLGKKDLMCPISQDETFGNLSNAKESIAFVALRINSFDAVEQILTEEGTTICVKDVLSDFMKNRYVDNKDLNRLLFSPVFKDTAENIEEMKKQLPERYFKKTKEDAKNAAKALNKAGIASIKAKAGR